MVLVVSLFFPDGKAQSASHEAALFYLLVVGVLFFLFCVFDGGVFAGSHGHIMGSYDGRAFDGDIGSCFHLYGVAGE